MKPKNIVYSEALYPGITRELVIGSSDFDARLLLYTNVSGNNVDRSGKNMMVLGFDEVSELKDYLEDWMVDNWPEETDD